MLEVRNLSVKIGEKQVLDNISFKLEKGEIIALMGPNGSGKTSLANTLMGNPEYKVIQGKIILDGQDITNLDPTERSLRGLFIAFQNPPEIPGVKLSSLLLASYNKKKGYTDDILKLTDPKLMKKIQEGIKQIGLPKQFIYRDVNVGFSGGERKRSEFLQAIILDPEYIILDEPDSGLDIDGLKTIGNLIKEMKEKGKGILLITHYTRIFDYVKPDKIIVLMNGRILVQDGPEIAQEIEEKGYSKLEEEYHKGETP